MITEVQATIQALAIVESITNDIDTLAVLDRQVKDLTAKCKVLKDDIANQYGEGKFRGEKYGVTVSLCNTTKVDYKSLLADVTTTFGIIVVIAGIVSTFIGGWVCDKLRPRMRGAYLFVSGLAILVAFPCTLAMLWTPFPYAWATVFGSVFFLFFNTGPANTALANVTSSSMRSTALVSSGRIS